MKEEIPGAVPGRGIPAPADSRGRKPGLTGFRLPRPLAWALKGIIAAVCLYIVYLKVPWASVGPALGRCDYSFILLSLVLQYTAAVAAAFRWKTLLRRPELALHKYLYFVLLGQFFNLFLPTYVASEAVKVLAFGRKYGGTQENIGIALLSKSVGMAVQILLGSIGLFLYWGELRERGLFSRMHLDGLFLIAAPVAAVAGMALLWWFRNSLKGQIWVRTMVEISRNRKLLAQTVFWTALIQLLAAASSYCLFLSLYPEARFWQITLFTTIILAVLSLPFGFGGVGVREYMNLLLFTDVGGIPAHITFAVNIVGYIPVLGTALTGGAWMAYRKFRP